MKLIPFLAALLIWSAPAVAVTWDWGCNGTADTKYKISKYQNACWTTTDSDADGLETALLRFDAASTLISFNPDTGQAVTTAARLKVWYCHSVTDATKPGTPANACLLLATLDGTQADDSSQDAFLRVGPGYYVLEQDVNADSGDTSVTTIQGEGRP